jgi:hypothetical protein
MPKECVAIAITKMGGLRNLRNVFIRNECALLKTNAYSATRKTSSKRRRTEKLPKKHSIFF